MKSNYKRIGDCIQLVDERNINLDVKTLLGLSISKEYIPSVANIIGTDMSNYRIIRKNQFACSTMQVRRDRKMPIALLEKYDEAIISAAYPVFQVADIEVVLPEYLMMWFRRSEFDREACFYAIGGVRGSIEWEDFCNMQLPVPSIAKQKEIVKEYNVLVDRIKLNKQLIQKLEETAQAIYKQWFIDFEFPDENGKPYKSNGGKMLFNEELEKEIPAEWEGKILGYYVSETKGGDWGSNKLDANNNSQVFCIRGADIPNLRRGNLGEMPTRYILENNLNMKELRENQIVIEISGGSPTQSTGRTVHISKTLLNSLNYPVICSNFCQVLTIREAVYSNFLFSHINYLYKADILYNYENSTIGLKNLDLSGVLAEEITTKPPNKVLEKYNSIYLKLSNSIISYGREVQLLTKYHDLLLANLMFSKTIEN